MSIQDVFQALGGGLVGLLGVAVVVLSVTIYWDLKTQIREQKADNKELRTTLGRLTDVVESWSPEKQKTSLRRQQ